MKKLVTSGWAVVYRGKPELMVIADVYVSEDLVSVGNLFEARIFLSEAAATAYAQDHWITDVTHESARVVPVVEFVQREEVSRE